MLWLIRPTASERRAPYSTRDSTSRPCASLPSRKAPEGGCKLAARSPRNGSPGASHGASNARTARIPTSPRPKRAQGSRASRVQKSGAAMGVSTTLLGTLPPGQADSAVKRDTPFTLVLGGGGMKGVAHVGVLQALLERGHRPTRIIGSSVGALVGAAWAGGMGIAKLREIALGLRRKDLFAVAHALGPELIIAVDVSASSVLTADGQDEGFAAVFARATEILMQTLLEQSVRTWTTPPVYYIQPRVEHVSLFSFDHLREEVEEGYRATSAALDREDEWPEPGDVGIFPKRRVVVRVERDRCIGCGTCLVQAPQGMFVLDSERKAVVTQPDQEWSPLDGGYIRHCPTYAIIARPAQQESTIRRSG